MIGSLGSPFPLERVSNDDLHTLTEVLWNWKFCDSCRNRNNCTTPTCSWRRSTRLTRFFEFYKEIALSYVPELLPGSVPALRCHNDIFDIIRLLKTHLDKTRSELTTEYFSQREESPQVADQHRAFNMAVKVMLMVACSSQDQPSGLLELGTQPIKWQSDETLAQFISRSFPEADTGDVYLGDMKSPLTARRLKKIAGLKFRGTDDLRHHLRLDSKKGVVEIYHYTSVLKEHLLASQATLEPQCSAKPVKVLVYRGNLPRQIALEALDSIQKILFPFDSGSESILRSLVTNESFDPDCLRYDSAAHRRDGEEDISYLYFRGRLIDLYEELMDPSPHGILAKWLQRRSGARHVMMATILGVAIAILLGILGLAVAIFQAWVSYEAWKHPVPSGNS